VDKRDFTRLLGWPGYRVYRYELDEASKKLKLWVRKKPNHRGYECSGCGRRVHAVIATWEREVADLDCFEFRTTVVLDVYRLDCVACGPKVERIEQVPSKAPYTNRTKTVGNLPGYSGIIRYKVLKRLGVKDRHAWEAVLPWNLISRAIDARLRITGYPVGTV
jgi:hypothetical protein